VPYKRVSGRCDVAISSRVPQLHVLHEREECSTSTEPTSTLCFTTTVAAHAECEHVGRRCPGRLSGSVAPSEIAEGIETKVTYKQKRLIVRRTRLVGPDFGGSNLKVCSRVAQVHFLPYKL